MKDQETMQRFIELRSHGWSFARIAAELNVSKPTLIAWSRKFQFDIQNQRAIELEALRDEVISTCEARARALGEQLRQVEAELAKRSVADLPTARLYSLADSLRRQIMRETGPMQFSTPVDKIPNDDYVSQAQDWKP
jgi:hypothetical protein